MPWLDVSVAVSWKTVLRATALIVRVANWPPTLTFRKNGSVEGVGVCAWTGTAHSARPPHSPKAYFTLAIKILVGCVREDARKFRAQVGKDGSTTVQVLVSFTRIYRP